MTIKHVPCCEYCDANTQPNKHALVVKRPNSRGHFHFCGLKCIVGFAQRNGELQRERKPYTKRRKHRKHRWALKYKCQACGMQCANQFVLDRHLKAKHDPKEYHDNVTKQRVLPTLSLGVLL